MTGMMQLHEADDSTAASEGFEGGGRGATTLELMLRALLED